MDIDELRATLLLWLWKCGKETAISPPAWQDCHNVEHLERRVVVHACRTFEF